MCEGRGGWRRPTHGGKTAQKAQKKSFFWYHADLPVRCTGQLRSGAAALVYRHAALALRTWREVADERARSLALLQRSVAKIRHRGRARAFGAWVDVVDAPAAALGSPHRCARSRFS